MRLKPNFLAVFAALFSFVCLSQLQAATITPNITTDPALGSDPANCSLRYAIESINNGAAETGCAGVTTGAFGTNDTVILGGETYALSLAGNEEGNNATGDLDVFNDIAITGAGSDLTVIDASGIPDRDRVIEFSGPPTGSISGVTITGGDVTGTGEGGGGIFGDELELNLQDVQVLGNSAIYGAGIYYDGEGATMLIDNSVIDGNTAVECGGGIYTDIGSVTAISNSTISRNEADNGGGGGIGGGICDDGEYLFLTNSTVSTNTVALNGGGISSAGGLKGMYNVTVAFNQSTGSAGRGGGMININCCGQDPRFTAEIFNTIVAQNTSALEPDCSGEFLTGGYNLIGEIGPNDNCTDFADGVNGDQVGTDTAPIDPLLGPLQLNGGATIGETHALLVGSPAIDRGNPAACQALDFSTFVPNDENAPISFVDLTTDQRLLTRPVPILDPAVPVCDIGAYELQIPEPTPTPTPTVTATPVPPFNAFLEGSGCSLTAMASASTSGFGSLALISLLGGMVHWRLRRRIR